MKDPQRSRPFCPRPVQARCLDTVNGHYPPAYFHAEGGATSSEAIIDSRNKAIAAAQGLNPSRSYYWCGVWVNR